MTARVPLRCCSASVYCASAVWCGSFLIAHCTDWRHGGMAACDINFSRRLLQVVSVRALALERGDLSVRRVRCVCCPCTNCRTLPGVAFAWPAILAVVSASVRIHRISYSSSSCYCTLYAQTDALCPAHTDCRRRGAFHTSACS